MKVINFSWWFVGNMHMVRQTKGRGKQIDDHEAELKGICIHIFFFLFFI